MIKKSRFTSLAVAVTLVIAALCMPAYAQTDKADTGQASTAAAAPPATAAAASGYGYVGLITVHVDQSYCGTGGVQCPVFGQAGPTNRNPVRLGVQLATSTMGISGVPTGSFTVVNPFVPAGGTAVARSTCAACFQDGGNGIYTVFVEPANAGVNWKSGAYFVQLQVTLGTIVLRALVQIEIPF